MFDRKAKLERILKKMMYTEKKDNALIAKTKEQKTYLMKENATRPKCGFFPNDRAITRLTCAQ